MKNSEIAVGMAVRVKHIIGPWMIVVAKTPGLFGAASAMCVWFSHENVQQNGAFRIEFLESKDEYEAERKRVVAQRASDLEKEHERRKMMQEVLRREKGSGFVKFGDEEDIALPFPSDGVDRL